MSEGDVEVGTQEVEIVNAPAEQAFHDMMDAIRALPDDAQEAQRVKFLAVFDERVSDLFFAKMDLAPAGPAYKVKRSTLYPSQSFVDAIAAVRAGELDWEIEDCSGLF